MKQYNYDYMRDFIVDVISTCLLRSFQNQLKKHWSRVGFEMTKSMTICGNTAELIITTPAGVKSYTIKVTENR